MTEKMVAMLLVGSIGLLLTVASAARYAITGEVNDDVLKVIGMMATFLLGTQVNGAATRMLNGTVRKNK